MDDEQLRRIARDLINTAIDNAMDKILKEEMAGDLDQGVDDIVKLTIGQSVTAIRDGKTSPTDDKMKEWVGHFDKELSDKVELTIRQSDTAIRDGQTSPSDNKMEGLLKKTPEVPTITTGSNSPEVSYAEIKQEVTGSGSDHLLQITPAIVQADETMTTRQFSETSGKKNVLGRLFDILFKRNKNGAKKIVTTTEGGSSGTSVDGQMTCSSKACSKKDWIRRNLLCCFVRQTAKAGGKYQ